MEKEVGMSKVPENGRIDHRRRQQGRGRRHIHQQNIFLPMFCRLSIKDVRLNQTKDRSNVPEPATISISPSTASGQVRRNKIVVGFAATTPSASASAGTRTATCNNLQNHSRSIKGCVSGETLVPKATTITTCTSNSAVGVSSSGGGSGGNRCRPGGGDLSLNDCKRAQVSKNDHANGNQDCVKAVICNMSAMDPPLPVVKRVAPPGAGGDQVNIWKRRFNGVALKSLQIQHQISPT